MNSAVPCAVADAARVELDVVQYWDLA